MPVLPAGPCSSVHDGASLSPVSSGRALVVSSLLADPSPSPSADDSDATVVTGEVVSVAADVTPMSFRSGSAAQRTKHSAPHTPTRETHRPYFSVLLMLGRRRSGEPIEIARRTAVRV